MTSCVDVNEKLGLPDDNPLEEMVEQVIKNETGLNIDLSPSDPDPDMPAPVAK